MSTHAHAHSHVAHHFDDAEQQLEAATLGMWAFLITEVLFFGGMFLGYAVYRYWYYDAFAAGSQHLDLWLGTINTGVLLCSSLTMALAVRAAQTSQRKLLVTLLLATIVLGAVFVGIKGYEYWHKHHEGLIPGEHFNNAAAVEDFPGVDPNKVQIFVSFYFAMTGLHAFHMLIGFGLLGLITWQSSQGRFHKDYYTPVELAGLYWHFVDIVWVFLFPLLYLVGER